MTRKRGGLLLVAAFAVAGVLLWQGLSNATVYFKTVDEAVAQRAELGDRRFRLEGIVVPGSKKSTKDAVEFTVTENNAEIKVRHFGDPPELFRENIPVVLEGRFQGATYHSDRILVKHTEEYRKGNPERVKDYKETEK